MLKKVSRWFRPSRNVNRPARRRFRPEVEPLEVREVLDVAYWTGNTSVDWYTPANWNKDSLAGGLLGRVPGELDDVIIRGSQTNGTLPGFHHDPYIDAPLTVTAIIKSLKSDTPVGNETPAVFGLSCKLKLDGGASVWAGAKLGTYDAGAMDDRGIIIVHGGSLRWQAGNIELEALRVQNGAFFYAESSANALRLGEFLLGSPLDGGGTFIMGSSGTSTTKLTNHVDANRLTILHIYPNGHLEFLNDANLATTGGFVWSDAFYKNVNGQADTEINSQGIRWYYVLYNQGTIKVTGIDQANPSTPVRIETPIYVVGASGVFELGTGTRAQVGPNVGAVAEAKMIYNYDALVKLSDGSQLQVTKGGYFQGGPNAPDNPSLLVRGAVTLIGSSLFYRGSIDLRVPVAGWSTFTIESGTMTLDGRNGVIDYYYNVDGGRANVSDKLIVGSNAIFKLIINGQNTNLVTFTKGLVPTPKPPNWGWNWAEKEPGGRMTGRWGNPGGITGNGYKIQYLNAQGEEVPNPDEFTEWETGRVIDEESSGGEQ